MADDYETGYGKPPRHTRFKPGVSGNPRGRPKGSRSWASITTKILSSKIEVTDRNGRKKMPLSEAILMQLAGKAAKGDIRSVRMLLELSPDLDAGASARRTPGLKQEDLEKLSDEELAQLYFEEIRRTQ